MIVFRIQVSSHKFLKMTETTRINQSAGHCIPKGIKDSFKF
ncbi:hypothetical protein MY4824_007773 [Beauveria thailandica]